MEDDYEKEYQKLKSEFIKDAEIALKESDKLYNEIANKLGHKRFLAHSVNKPIKECEQKYQIKFKELKEKYNK